MELGVDNNQRIIARNLVDVREIIRRCFSLLWTSEHCGGLPLQFVKSILGNRTDVARSWSNKLIIRVLLSSVGDPADGASQSKDGYGRFGRQAECTYEDGQAKIQIWIFASEGVRRLDQPFRQFEFPRPAIGFGKVN